MARRMTGSWMNIDGNLILLEKCVRTIPYGFLSVVFAIYLKQLGFDDVLIGIVLALTIFSSALYTFLASFLADRFGRKRTLVLFAATDFVAGSFLFLSTAWWAPVIAGIVGNMTVGSGEVGPPVSLEQAILPKTVDLKHRTLGFSYYNLVGYAASSLGALLAGVPQYLGSGILGYRPLFLGYLISGLAGTFIYSRLSRSVELEAAAKAQKRLVLSQRSKPIVLKLSALFAMDSFGGGFIVQNIIALYFYERFALNLDLLGSIFFGTQIVTAISFLAAERIARRIGLLNTMVFSHIPSNLFLAAIAFAPTPVSAVVLLLCRHSLSQMDVPTRQSYVMAVIDENDRTAAAGFTNVSRTIAQAFGPYPSLYALANIWIGAPFVVAGTLKIAYDLIVYGSFRKIRPPEETSRR